jgi:arginyl-tRNA--protein-N-Asp/Glu arginylyltransferase
MATKLVTIKCPDCHGTGHVLKKWYGTGFGNSGDIMYEETDKNCKRCVGLGVLKKKLSEIKEAG